MRTQSLDLGGIRISWLDGGSFELDGGTMFGPVPKVLWSRAYPADKDNYIKMIAAPLLVEATTATILVDTGLGNKLTEKQEAIFRVSRKWNLLKSLSERGLSADDIDCVILTHCDFDHAGGVIMHDPEGMPRLTFPRARHFINTMEWYDAGHPNSRSAHTYFPENFNLLADGGVLELIEHDREIVPGVTVRHTGGHTRGHQLVEMTGSAKGAVHMGDLMPTHAHANPLWIMAYDNFPIDVISRKEELVQRYRNCWFTFYHDAYLKAGRLDETGKITQGIT